MKRMIAVTMITMLMLFQAYAATKAFMITDEAGGPDWLCLARDGSTPAPTGWYVQKCVSGASAVPDYSGADAKPWTNQVAASGNAYGNYIFTNACQEYEIGLCAMGYDTAAQGITEKDGSVSGAIGSSDTTRRGWLRTFSAATIRGAAYYGDTPGADAGRTLNNTTWVFEWSAAPTVNIINPAYNGLALKVLNSTYGAIAYGSAPNYGISGQVQNVTSTGSNTLLDQDNLAVYWRTNGDPTWYAVASLAWTGNGGWSGTYPGGSDVMVGMSGGATLLPNSSGPVGIGYQGPLPVQPIVPEPALAFAGLIALALLRKVR